MAPPKATAAHAEQACGCVFVPFGNYFLTECARHAAARRRRKKVGRPPPKRWQFCWCDAASPPANGDAHDWKSRTVRAPSFEKAMDLMLAFIRAKPFDCLVDSECRALHVSKHARHERKYPRVDRAEHELRGYVD